MTDANCDAWATGDAYEAYMGRWSRRVADAFVTWLSPPPNAHWLELGCGTGALTSRICQQCDPSSIVGCDPSPSFVEHARGNLVRQGASFEVASSDELPAREGGFDLVVSGLVLNFLAQPVAAVAAMNERARSGGVIAAYVWDYAGGLEFVHHFWQEAVALDPTATPLDESARFGAWTQTHLVACFETAGLVAVETTVLDVATRFVSFDDYWLPFLGGTGPAPTYVGSLPPHSREQLARRLRARLPVAGDGTISLRARALAVRGVRP